MHYLHPLNGVRGGVGSVDEAGVLHVLCEALQEAEWLIKDHWHRDLGELLKTKKQTFEEIITDRK